MSPVAHFIGSWLVAVAMVDNPRDRRLVTLAGILPDADGLGIVVDVVRHIATGQELNFYYYQKFHHVGLHGWPGGLVIAGSLAGFANQRWRVALGCWISFHLHLLCDLMGSRGPSPADLWPISYSEPLFHQPVWLWEHQWRLDGWQNSVLLMVAFAFAVWITITRGVSFAELFGRRADTAFTDTLRKWARCDSRQPRDGESEAKVSRPLLRKHNLAPGFRQQVRKS